MFGSKKENQTCLEGVIKTRALNWEPAPTSQVSKYITLPSLKKNALHLKLGLRFEDNVRNLSTKLFYIILTNIWIIKLTRIDEKRREQ